MSEDERKKLEEQELERREQVEKARQGTPKTAEGRRTPEQIQQAIKEMKQAKMEGRWVAGAKTNRVTSQDAQLVCPHCQVRGFVETYEIVVQDGGPSWWSVLLAPLTYGLSLLYGWKFKEYGSTAYCSNCGRRWRIE